MFSTEPLVSPESQYFFYTCTQTAKRLFFYPVCVGEFRYDPGYALSRSQYNSFLIMAITKGSCLVQAGSNQFKAQAGDVVLLDCYAPHGYRSDHGWESVWLHFDGPQSRGFYEYITAQQSSLLHPEAFGEIRRELEKIYWQFCSGAPIAEPELSLSITQLLTHLTVSRRQIPEKNAGALEMAAAYLREHFQEPVRLDELAAMTSLSPYYFTRLFTKQIGQTPHQYLLSVRIDSARFLLKSSGMSIKEIGFACGFLSESSFSATFRKRTGQTPGEYRQSL